MSKQLLIYNEILPLSSETHRNWSVEIKDHSFVSEINSVPLVSSEIVQVARELPVIFAKTAQDGDFVPLAVVGLKRGENLMLDENKRMALKFVPGFVRRYPFVFANAGQNENLTLCIDDTYEGWSKDGTEGRRLFNDQGEQTEELKQTMEFLRDYQHRAELTSVFCKKLADLNLLDPMEANIKAKEGSDEEGFSLTGFYVVNRERLKALKDEDVLDLFKKDGLELIFSHLQSLPNLNMLVDKYAKKGASASA
ncbi:SapC family protein [Marinimicrobium sp. ABcell2]|uniref:SapC family protein n=1 Tax=Marinimicrobium sp. ABcell2 TaxID=3069751 RepID=UPI0027AF64F4|nr:SapC family protein [Marinimicrobium sp. ABcell2]MDQ2077293.1 SapC family protein [Marinimicrobium sp. ABcell2]